MLRGETKTVNGTVAILTEVNFIDVRLEDGVLFVMRIKQQRHDRFGRFASKRALVRKIKVFDELLRQRAAALHRATGTKVCPKRARDAARIDAMMLVKFPILDGD